MRKIVLLAIACVGSVIALALNAFGSPRLPKESGASSTTSTTPVLQGSDPKWIKELEGGSRIEVFRSDTAASDPESLPLRAMESRGKLAPVDVARARTFVDPESNKNALLAAQTAAERSGTLGDYTTFVFELAATEKFRAASEMLDSGDYVVLAAGTKLPPIPEDYLLVRIPRFKRREPVESCDLVFFIPKAKYAALANAWDSYVAAQFAANDAECKAFNELPQEQRVATIAAHDRARAVIDATADKYSPELAPHRKALIPGKFIIDKRFSLISVRPVAHR